MPAYNFGGRDLPTTIRIARALLYLEAGILVLAGVFAVILGVLLGSGDAIPFAGTTLSGQGAAFIGLLYVAMGGGAVYLAVELGRLTGWSRVAIIGLQAVLIVLFMARGDFSISLVLSLALCIGIAVLLVSSSATAALERGKAVAPDASTPQPNG